MWDTIEDLRWQAVARAGRLPGPAPHQRVDGEWSFAETLRHLVLATGKWAGHMVVGKPVPCHRLGLPCTATPPADVAAPAAPETDSAGPGRAGNAYVREDRVLPQLHALHCWPAWSLPPVPGGAPAGEPAHGPRQRARKTRSGTCASKGITLTYDQAAGTLHAGTAEAAKTITVKAS